jgi:ABC-type phosphate/phosphonate transport system ATPase subunit
MVVPRRVRPSGERQLTAVVSREAKARTALLDVISGRLVPTEGRAWIRGLLVARENAHLVRRRVGEVDLGGCLADEQSVLWNVLWPASRRFDLLRAYWRAASATWRRRGLQALESVELDTFAGVALRKLDRRSRYRLLIARALVPDPEVAVVARPDGDLPQPDATDFLGVLRAVARARRLAMLVSVTDPVLAHMLADRVLALDDGRLALDGQGVAATESR